MIDSIEEAYLDGRWEEYEAYLDGRLGELWLEEANITLTEVANELQETV